MSDHELKAPCNGVVVVLPNGRFADQDAHAFTGWVQDSKDPSWLFRVCALCLAMERRKVKALECD